MRNNYPQTIRTLNLFSVKERKNTKFNLILDKEKVLQMEFAYSINNFELLIALIEYDLMVISYLRSRAVDIEEYNKNKAWYNKKKKIGYTYKPEVSDYFQNKAGIYMFINKVNKKIYIGKANDLCDRIMDYANKDYLKKKSNSKIIKALLKYKFNNFTFSILEYCPIDKLRFKEQYFIDLISPQYNIRRITHKDYFVNGIHKTFNIKPN